MFSRPRTQVLPSDTIFKKSIGGQLFCGEKKFGLNDQFSPGTST